MWIRQHFFEKENFLGYHHMVCSRKTKHTLYILHVKTDECEINFAKLHVNALDTILTETDIFPNTSSGIGPLSFFINLSRHVVINSIQINTSDYQNNTQIHVNKTPIN